MARKRRTADDELLVRADALQQEGDPRGEFIALQLARIRGEDTPATRAREKALLAKHGNAWVGGIAKSIAATDRLWERGALVGCTLKTGAVDAIRKTQGSEAWRTVRELGFDGRPFRPPPESIVPFLAEPVMAALRGLHSLEELPLAALLACARPPKLDHLILHHGQARWAPCERFGMHTLGAAMSFTSMSLADLPDCVTTFYARERTIAEWLPHLNKAGRHLTRFEMRWGHLYMPVEQYAIVLERSGKKFDRMHVTLRGGGIALELAGTPARSFSQITVDGVPSPDTQKALARLGWRAPT